jgi:hypothetical protein
LEFKPIVKKSYIDSNKEEALDRLKKMEKFSNLVFEAKEFMSKKLADPKCDKKIFKNYVVYYGVYGLQFTYKESQKTKKNQT